MPGSRRQNKLFLLFMKFLTLHDPSCLTWSTHTVGSVIPAVRGLATGLHTIDMAQMPIIASKRKYEVCFIIFISLLL